jgi:ABC-type phosphonate transport system ATPase subunit
MKSLSLKMDEAIFKETERILIKVRKNRNRYINDAVQFYNLLQQRKFLARNLKTESRLVREESMKVLREFENLENEN